MEKILFWFRRDLRLKDNQGLLAARDKAEQLYTCGIIDRSHKEWKFRCGDRLQFKLQCLDALQDRVRDCGGELYLRVGKPAQKIVSLVRKLKADAVFWNRAYEPYERKRDEAAREQLEQTGIEVQTFKDQVMCERRELLTGKGTPYRVFTPYSKKWRLQELPEPVEAVKRIEEEETVEAGSLPAVEELGLETRLDAINWEPSSEAARQLADNFFQKQVINYEDDRDFPAHSGTSRLSPCLRFGLLSVRELYWDCQEKMDQTVQFEGVKTFVDELIWRDFYHQIIYNYPHVVEENFKEKYDGVKWEENEEWLARWKAGRTGYPIVDAGMRQLNQTGWMHNRLRMIVAMFLTKDCLLHWKHGEQYFMNRLLDGDTAANNGGWQWSASTGADGAPYFRIFNPVTQGRRYDPEAEFIRQYCPELAELPDEAVHAPFEAEPDELAAAGIELGEDYPEPMVDHSVRRAIALNRFKTAAG